MNYCPIRSCVLKYDWTLLLENADGEAVTVNLEHYGRIATDLFPHIFEENDLENMWFQQDNVTCRAIRTVMAF